MISETTDIEIENTTTLAFYYLGDHGHIIQDLRL